MAFVDELSDAEVDEVLARFDQTEELLKRRIIAELVATKTLGSKWQPIETAPRDGNSVLVVHRGNDLKIAYNGGANGWRTIPGAWQIMPTHWMPLPEPPATA
jgi:hypothetical protein